MASKTMVVRPFKALSCYSSFPPSRPALYYILAIAGAILAVATVLLPWPSIFLKFVSQTSAIPDHGYTAQIFSRDPLIMHIQNFISDEEIAHLLRLG